MTRRIVVRTIAAITLAIGLVSSGVGGLNPAAAAQRAAESQFPGAVNVVIGEAFVQQLFKAGVFMYGASEVTVAMGDSGALTVTFPLTGASTTRPTTAIAVDPEAGGLSLFNGPAQATAGFGNIVIRRTGTTGTVMARVVGPYSAESGQFDKTLTIFTISAARAKRTSHGWTMRGTLALTAEGASTLNTLLKTNVFTAAPTFASLDADVVSR